MGEVRPRPRVCSPGRSDVPEPVWMKCGPALSPRHFLSPGSPVVDLLPLWLTLFPLWLTLAPPVVDRVPLVADPCSPCGQPCPLWLSPAPPAVDPCPTHVPAPSSHGCVGSIPESLEDASLHNIIVARTPRPGRLPCPSSLTDGPALVCPLAPGHRLLFPFPFRSPAPVAPGPPVRTLISPPLLAIAPLFWLSLSFLPGPALPTPH